ncbi:MAG TPA: sigma-70 family RNA polymerase sigma factor [Candidatus Sulfotelmatobacter sp.]|nr:sigma-70 family RNA polymerase sigma factor [Candidatus Sulfotelmatobacter sp.]
MSAAISYRMTQKPDEIIPTRESLLRRLKNWKDEESWREFFSIYRKLIFSLASKSGLSAQESEEVVQETVISVAKTIPDFEYDPDRCSFKSWLRHLAQKRIADCFRKRARERTVGFPGPDETGKTAPIERIPDANAVKMDAIWEEEWQKELLNASMVRIKNQVSAEQYQMFDFYVLKKMPVEKVAAALGTNTAQIYLAKHRITKLLKKEIARLEEKMGD